MKNRPKVGLAVCLAVSFCLPASARAARPLPSVVSQEAAQRCGLERAWATQVELDQSRGRIAHISLQAGLLLVQTDQAAVHVLDAETRRTLWVGHIGQPGAVTTPPAASDKFVVSTNGSILCLFDRATGKVLWTRNLKSVPSAGPAISDDRIYVPLVSGMLSAHRLPNPNSKETLTEQKLKDNSLYYMGKGIAYVAPIVTHGNVVWGTDEGNVYGVTHDELVAVYRFKAKDSVIAGLAYRYPYIYVGSRDGYLYALVDQKGAPRWQFSVGNPIVETPMATGDGVYVIPETGGLYKLTPEKGEEVWSSPGVFRFIAASPTRLYTADAAGRMLILDSRTGTRLGMMSTENLPIKVFNRDNDRIYLATRTGLVQCLHEVALKDPASWRLPTGPSDDGKVKGKGKEKGSQKEKAATPAAEDGADPFGAAGDDGDEG